MASVDYTLMKGEGLIRVQRGLYYSGATTAASVNIGLPIAIADTNLASIRLLGARDVMQDNQYYPFGRLSLANSTTLTFTRSAARSFGGNSSFYVTWEVTEFSNVRIQRGVSTAEFGMGNAIWTAIASVDVAKSEVHCLGVTPNTGNFNSGSGCYFPALNTSQIGFNAEGSGSGAAETIGWEVVTFNGG